jgi:two-component system, response regulator FlrC
VDIRLIATSNRDMLKAVQDGVFREDLYYRLNVFNLELPPLRERPQDIAQLSLHFIAKYAKANGLDSMPIAPEAVKLLSGHRWPGNVRELENTMHRAVLLAQHGLIDVNAIMLSPTRESMTRKPVSPMETPQDIVSGDMVGRTVADVERDLIIGTVGHCLGNRTHAANILGISIRTLRNKLKQYQDEGVSVPPSRESA